ncbi:hypothetical protein FRX31_003307 [Thalictrum thalictroides]|uniref:Pentatricopeptide repeat-containing protein n=1 Tax=Thalictrum thalictroides TaxID=46969 RepID=A0A7J6XBD1_THATH|nr:hypothetical protein FRX31_003307 [Thalictrum thalictroides]
MLHDAEALFHVMVEKSLVPDNFTFNILAQGFLVQGSDADKAMHFVNTMIEKGFSPNAETMSKLLNLQVPGGPNQERINMLLNFAHKTYCKGSFWPESKAREYQLKQELQTVQAKERDVCVSISKSLPSHSFSLLHRSFKLELCPPCACGRMIKIINKTIHHGATDHNLIRSCVKMININLLR